MRSALLAGALLVAACSRPDTDSGDTAHEEDFEGLHLAPVGNATPYASLLRHGPGGLYALGEGGLFLAEDEHSTWYPVVEGDVDDVAAVGELVYVLRDEVVWLLRPQGGMEALDAPWASLDVTFVNLAAAGDTLWVQVQSKEAEHEVAPSRLWTWRDQTWTEAATPDDIPLWALRPTSTGGLLVWSISTPLQTYPIMTTDDGSSWSTLGSYPRVYDLLALSTGTLLVSVHRGPPADRPVFLRIPPQGEAEEILAMGFDGLSLVEAPGGRVFALDHSGHWVSVSHNDGRTWDLELIEAPYSGLVSLLATDDALLAARSDFLMAMPLDDPRWRMAGLPQGLGHGFLDVEILGDRVLASLYDSTPGGQQRLVFSVDGGEIWWPADKFLADGRALCGSEEGWLVGGGPGAEGASYALIDAEGFGLLKDGWVGGLPSGSSFLDCVAELGEDDEPRLTAVFADSLRASGALAVSHPDHLDQWSLHDLPDLGSDLAPTTVSGSTSDRLISLQVGDEVAWAHRSDPDQGWEVFDSHLAMAPADGAGSVFGAGEDLYRAEWREEGVQIETLDHRGLHGAEILGLATDAEGRLWLATTEGLFRSEEAVDSLP